MHSYSLQSVASLHLVGTEFTLYTILSLRPWVVYIPYQRPRRGVTYTCILYENHFAYDILVYIVCIHKISSKQAM